MIFRQIRLKKEKTSKVRVRPLLLTFSPKILYIYRRFLRKTVNFHLMTAVLYLFVTKTYNLRRRANSTNLNLFKR